MPKLTPKRMRQISTLDARAGAPVGRALEQAADHIETLTAALYLIHRTALRCRGDQAHRDTIKAIEKASRIYSDCPLEDEPGGSTHG